MTRKSEPLAIKLNIPLVVRDQKRREAEGALVETRELTLLVCNGTDLLDLAVQRGHKLGVATNTGEVGGHAARGGNAGFCCV